MTGMPVPAECIFEVVSVFVRRYVGSVVEETQRSHRGGEAGSYSFTSKYDGADNQTNASEQIHTLGQSFSKTLIRM